MKKKNRFLESCAFLLVLGAVLVLVSGLLERKNSRNQFGPFIETAKEYDVLFFGDSRFVNALLPMELWADHGIAGYNLSCYGSTMPVCYWSMINALDHASPKLVVLAVNGVRKDIKVTGSSADLHTALDFFPLTPNKVRAVWDLTDDPEALDDDGNRFIDMRWEYLLTIGKYHSRWSELTADDFAYRRNGNKGTEVMVGVAPYKEYSLIEPDVFAEEQGAGYRYLRMAIEACQSRGIDVLLVHLPYPASEDSQMHGNTVSGVAQEYGVGYVDFVSLDSVADYAVDCYDAESHLNPSGAQKVTAYLGDYIASHYALPDRRQDGAYAHWEGEHDAYVDGKLSLIREHAQDLHSLLMLLHDDDFTVRAGMRPGAPLYWDDTAILLMHNMAREHVVQENEFDMWSNAMYPLEVFDAASWEDDAYFLSLSGFAPQELRGEEAEAAMEAAFGADALESTLIQVMDNRTGEIAAEMRF